MANGRLAGTARRATLVAVLGGMIALAGSLLIASPAAAAPTASVVIRDLTPPVVSVDAGGTVTFTNQIADKTVQVGGGGLVPSLVSVTAHTDVTLGLPSGSRPLQPGASVSQSFSGTCATCSITYTYRLTSNASLTSALTGAALGQLPALPAPTPFVVNTILPDLPNLPSVNVPSPPPVTVDVPQLPTTPDVPAANPDTPTTPEAAPVPAAEPAPAAVPVEGTPYAYGSSAGGVAMTPTGNSGAAVFSPNSRLGTANGQYSSTSGSGAGSTPGTYDGASVPVFGELAGMDGSTLNGQPTDVTVASDAETTAQDAALSIPGLLAVIALAAVSAAWFRARSA